MQNYWFHRSLLPIRLHLQQALLHGGILMEWVTDCKSPFKDPAHVVEYLGRYPHRVAISNSRFSHR
ncbi:transposase [Alicyclobacillus acidoterrestris]|uniref:Transposase n=1 Tax=Alicyclobacillus acidoterrestris (strain ATCC 49025 / DSM 3922 / CIP 106132 / NCIMB 13137 / GD3B) TaxID=1356854 RepID=A0A9E6ZRK0_ALIAG|nr:transposase [Alicyclobacillus acidoterrestris]UNO47869.1 transposase [Alicyclobacillus acidoterrestris]GEO27924.1 hypothetical protein AAC03nite_37090 [Alicyclobacillus acidoterrestris]